MGKYYQRQRPEIYSGPSRKPEGKKSWRAITAFVIGFVALGKLMTDEAIGTSANDPGCWQNPLRNSATVVSRPFGFVAGAYGNYTDNKHSGIDLLWEGVAGASVYPGYVCGESEVTWINFSDGSQIGPGNAIELKHQNGLYTRYYHGLRRPVLTQGDVVDKDSVILYVGSTGNSMGPHLHFEIRVREGQWQYPITVRYFGDGFGKGDGFLDPADYLRLK